MARRGAVRNLAEFIPAWLAVQTLRWLPLFLARPLSRLMADITRMLTPRWRAVAGVNLDLAFPEWDEARRQKTIKASYRTLGANALALACLPSLSSDNVRQWIRYEGFENYENAMSEGGGAVLLTAHLGAWELSAAAHALFGHPMSLLVRPLDNPYIDRMVDARRTLFGNRTIRKQDAAREVLTALREKRAVGILADQNAAGADGVFVDFFGRPASATKGVAQLAARSGAAVVPGFAIWSSDEGRYILRFYPAVDLQATEDREADLQENTQRCQSAIEMAIREYPEQWLWMHRRWKRQPEGQPAVY